MSRSRAAETAVRIDLRRAILEAAARILADEGLPALSVRRVAADVGASTMGVYTHFRDKDGLVDAVIAESFDRFASALEAVAHPDPWEHLRELGRAYRRFARAHPSAYKLLFQRAAPDHAIPPSAGRGFAALTRAVGRVLAQLDRSARDIEPTALQVWGTTHGIVSLELTGACRDVDTDAMFEGTLAFIEAAIRGGAVSSAAPAR